jgi:hypothetical protein
MVKGGLMKQIKTNGSMLMLIAILVLIVTVIIFSIYKKDIRENFTPGQGYIEVILWAKSDSSNNEFVSQRWTDFLTKYQNIPQVKMSRKNCNLIEDFYKTIPLMVPIIQALSAERLTEELNRVCPCVMIVLQDSSGNIVRREIKQTIYGDNLNYDSVESAFKHFYNKGYGEPPKTVSETTI